MLLLRIGKRIRNDRMVSSISALKGNSSNSNNNNNSNNSNYNNSNSSSSSSIKSSLLVSSLLLSMSCLLMNSRSYNDNEKPPTERVYRLSEVSSHTTKETGIWVIYNNDVYDITKFVANHPGGQDKIMLAAGKSVEPFWRLYRQHYNSKLPMELLGNTTSLSLS